VDITKWYNEIPKNLRDLKNILNHQPKVSKPTRIEHYYTSQKCPICDQITKKGLCNECENDKQSSLFILQNKKRLVERDKNHLNEICMYCMGNRREEIECQSLDCSVLFERIKVSKENKNIEEFISSLNW